MKKNILFTILIIIISAATFGYYMFNKPHESISGKTPVFSVTANNLIQEFEGNENMANSKYLGKVINVTGVVLEKTIDEKGKLNVTLRGSDIGGVGCQFDKKYLDQAKTIPEGSTVSIKGICTGILMDVVLVDCVVNVDKN